MSDYRYTAKKFLRDWMLIISMAVGASVYLIYHDIPALHSAGPILEIICKTVQPLCLFMMLFLSFCKIEPQQMRPHKWQAWLLLIQGGLFAALVMLMYFALHSEGRLAEMVIRKRVMLEAAMLCLICPTATACAVVTGKLGGNMASVVTYTVLINLLVALAVPALIPLIYSSADMTFAQAFRKILAKVFPLLIMPCLTAWGIRYLMPRFHKWLLRYTQLSFYIWAFSLSLAILMSTRALVHNEAGTGLLLDIALSSLVCCIFQFLVGKSIGSRYGCRISAGQAMGQKNTVFAIWMGYTFMNPVVSIAGGFYSIWHNVFNSWQLYRCRKRNEASIVK